MRAPHKVFIVQQEMISNHAAVSQQAWLCGMLKGRGCKWRQSDSSPPRIGHPGHLKSWPSCLQTTGLDKWDTIYIMAWLQFECWTMVWVCWRFKNLNIIWIQYLVFFLYLTINLSIVPPISQAFRTTYRKSNFRHLSFHCLLIIALKMPLISFSCTAIMSALASVVVGRCVTALPFPFECFSLCLLILFMTRNALGLLILKHCPPAFFLPD